MTLAFLVPFSPHLIYFKSSTSLTTATYQRAGSRVECACVLHVYVRPQHLQCYVGSQTCRLVWQAGRHTSPPSSSCVLPLCLLHSVSTCLSLQHQIPHDQNRKCSQSTYVEANKEESHDRMKLTRNSQQHPPGNGFSTFTAQITSFIKCWRNKPRQCWSTLI